MSPQLAVDIGIMTIREDEFRAVLDAFPGDRGVFVGRRRHYNLCSADAGNGTIYRVAILRQAEQGNGEAQDAARDLIYDLCPRLLLLVGIAGGLPHDEFSLGDVVLSTRINDYTVEARKEGATPTYSMTGGPIDREIASGVANLQARELELVDWTLGLPNRPVVSWNRRLYGPPEWRRNVRQSLEHNFGDGRRRSPIFTSGVIASSDRLIKDPNVLFPWIQTARHLLAVDMESGGVYRAARGRVHMLAIRGISDIVGLKRDRNWTVYACATAAAFTKAYLRTTPLANGSRVSLSLPSAQLPPALLTSAEPFLLVGRETAVSQLETLVQRGEKVILIRGTGGIGKTTLAIQIMRKIKIDLVLDLWMAKDSKDVVSVEGRIAEWLRGAFQEEPARKFSTTLDQLRSKLRDGSRRIAVLIDNLEPALDGRGRFIMAHRRYVELLRLLADPAAQSIALITSRERLLEPSIRVCDYPLLGISEMAWGEFLENRRIRASPEVLSAMHQAYEGSPKAMQILAGAIENDFAADADGYWLSRQSPPAEQELENLIAEQFDRLRQVNPLSYRLLCRLGCYRYQDVSLPLAGVVPLLWETSPDDAARHARVLQERALLKFRGDLFWLHPITKAEALTRLKQSGEWRQANLAAAAYWTDSIDCIDTVENALHAFEAYYHHLAIGDSAGAGEVILRRRECTERDLSRGGEPLDAAFYRLGLLQNLLSAITSILGQIPTGYSLGKLYDVLGLAYRLLGRLTEAFGCHFKISEMAQSTGSLELQIASLILAGYCKTDLWELSAAIAYFEVLEKVSAETVFHRYAIMAWAYLAYLHSSAEPQTDVDVLLYIRKVEDSLGRPDLNAWRKAYATFLLGVAYRNLGYDDAAQGMIERSIDTALSSSHTQIHARALSYMGRLCAAKTHFSKALSYHDQAIRLLERLAAQCDLAGAHFLAGLTWQEKGEVMECREHFAQAEQLFSAIGAEAQVARVQRAAHG